jgi:uncharacterized protein YneF (UPF0154 family)
MERKKLKSVILRGLVLVLAFSLGLAAGGYIGYRMAAAPFIFMNTMFRVGLATEYANLQYCNAGYPEAKEALLKLISLFEDLKNKEWYENRKRVYYVETGLTYARLSLLEEKNGNISEKDKFMRQAINRLQQAGWKDYSEKRIREVVERLDRQNPFKTKGSDK